MSLGWLIVALALPLCSLATHLVGGGLYYDYLGEDNYEIHLVIYRDCGPTNTNGTGFDPIATLGVYEGTGLYTTIDIPLGTNAISNLDLQSGNPCANLPPGVCLERAVYTAVVTLPASTQKYTLVHQRCCRNPQVINLVDPSNTGFTIFGEIPAVLGTPGFENLTSSSPRYTSLPQAYVCLGAPFSLPNPAEDLDGDSLFFTLGDIFIGGTAAAPTPNPPSPPPYDNVTWEDGFAPLSPLGETQTDWIEIDPATGTITGTPGAVGKYAIGIYINELRQDEDGNWISLGKIIRDFTIDVVQCEILLPDVEWPDPCSGLDVAFTVNADEGNFSWDFGVEGEADTSSATSPNFMFPVAGEYAVSLEYDLGGCGDTVQNTILVAPPVNADFALTDMACTASGWAQGVLYIGDDPGSGGALTWSVDGTPVDSGTTPQPLHVPPGNHALSVSLETVMGCTQEHTESLGLPDLPDAQFTISTPPCNGLEVGFENQSTGTDVFAWTFDTSDPSTGGGPLAGMENLTWTYSGFGNFEVALIAQPGEACADTLTATVSVQPEDPLIMAFTAIEPLACSMETTVEFRFLGANADEVNWNFGGAGSATGDTVVHDFVDPGSYTVSLNIQHAECGTSQTEEFEVFIPELIADVELVIPNVLTPNADGKNDRFRVGTRRLDGGGVAPTNAASFSQFRLRIFDRWGVLVHESEGVGAGWDGRIGNTVAAPGTYYYILDADHSCLDADITEMGEVTLIVD